MNNSQTSEYLARILNTIDSAIIIVDKNGNIIDCNDAVYNIFLYNCTEIKKKNLKDFMFPLYEILKGAKEFLIDNEKYIINASKKNKEEFYCEVIAYEFNNENSEQTILFVIQDVHDKEVTKYKLLQALEITKETLKIFAGV